MIKLFSRKPKSEKQRVLIVGLDSFARKNLNQCRWLVTKGYSFDISTSDRRGDSKQIFSELNCRKSNIFVNRKWESLIFVIKQLTRVRYCHVELYPGGRVSFLNVLICRMFFVKHFVIERGDVGSTSSYPLNMRLSLYLSHILAKKVVYREPYQGEQILKREGNKVLIPNCVELPPLVPKKNDLVRRGFNKKFLWVNRDISQRYLEWLIQTFVESSSLRLSTLTVLGLAQDQIVSYQKKIGDNKNIRLYPFVNPYEFYREADFFCLPSEIVFGNNSLLEAMAHGLVPVVTNTEATSLIVRDGIDGLVTEKEYLSYRKGIEKANEMLPEVYQRLSKGARKRVKENFSVAAWLENHELFYEAL